MSQSVVIDGVEFILYGQYEGILLLRPINGSEDINIPLIGQAILKQNIQEISDVIATDIELAIVMREGASLPLDILNKTTVTSLHKHSYDLPVWFSREDLEAVEKRLGIGKEAYISHLISAEYSIAMFGFLAGFVYMNGLDSSMHLARKSNPTLLKRKNALAIGDKYLGFYSQISPAGWNILGYSPFSIMQLPVRNSVNEGLNINDKIKLVQINEKEYLKMVESLNHRS